MTRTAEDVEAAIRADLDRLVMEARTPLLAIPQTAVSTNAAMPNVGSTFALSQHVELPAAAWTSFVLKWGRPS